MIGYVAPNYIALEADAITSAEALMYTHCFSIVAGTTCGTPSRYSHAHYLRILLADQRDEALQENFKAVRETCGFSKQFWKGFGGIAVEGE
jgi:hypothetical protein